MKYLALKILTNAMNTVKILDKLYVLELGLNQKLNCYNYS